MKSCQHKASSASIFLHSLCSLIHFSFNECSLPLQCFAGPGRRFSLCPVSPAPLGPHTSWVPVPSALLPLDSAQALNVPLSVHCPVFLALFLGPSLHHFRRLPRRIPAAVRGPAPTELPQSLGLRWTGYSEWQGQGWSGYPVSSDCPGRRQRKTLSCS